MPGTAVRVPAGSKKSVSARRPSTSRLQAGRVRSVANDDSDKPRGGRGSEAEGGDLDVGFGVRIPARELIERVSRAGGPGGQRVNKVATRVSLAWDVASSRVLDDDQRAQLKTRLATRLVREGAIVVHVQSSREQSKNRAEARRRLREIVSAALAPPGPPRRPTRPTRGSVTRRLDGKRRRSETKRTRRPAGGDD